MAESIDKLETEGFGMTGLISVIIVILTVLLASRYCWQTVRGDIEPVLATWLLFSVATVLQMVTYLKLASSHSFGSNIYATADTVAVLLTFLTAALAGKKVRLGFNWFEIGCLAAAMTIGLVWWISQSHFVCNLAIQLIMVVAYFPIVRHLWTSDRNTEPYFTWCLTLIAASLALYRPISTRDAIAMIYVARAIISVMIVLSLMLRLDHFRPKRPTLP